MDATTPKQWHLSWFQKLYYVKEAHGIFVTGLEFLPVSENAREVTGSQDFSLLSISADNTVRIHQEPTRGTTCAAMYCLTWNVWFVFLVSQL